MGFIGMAAPRGNSAQPADDGLASRVRRALIAAGWPALLFGAALGLLQARPNILPLQLPVFVSERILPVIMMQVIGLVVGAIVGLWLYATRSLLRFSVALFTVLIALIVSEIVRGLLLDLSLWESLTETADWLEAAQLLSAAAGVVIGIRTGHHVVVHPPEQPASSRSRPARRQRRRNSTPAPRERRRPSSATQPQQGQSATADTDTGRTNGSAPMRVPRPAPTRAKSIKPKPRAKRARRKVHLGRQVTTVCPYCLEEVTRNDPRGRMVCKICGTPHHGDCWAITGKCEVPHLQP